MKRLVIILMLFVVTIFFNTCKDNGTDPEELTPGRRDYVWSMDTMKIPQNEKAILTGMWGSSANDIWAIGDASSFKYTVWHFDGNKWTSYQSTTPIVGAGIFGITKNYIWLGTSDNEFFRFDGNNWISHSIHKRHDADNTSNMKIHGTSANNIYAVGLSINHDNSNLNRVLMKYNGSDWNFIELPNVAEQLNDIAVEKKSGNVFINGVRDVLTDTKTFRYILSNNSELIQLDSNKTTNTFGKIGNTVYHIIGTKIFTYENEKLNLFKDLSNTNFGGKMWGRSEKDFFTVNHDYNIGHYNGSNLTDIYKLDNRTFVTDAVIFEKEVFFLCINFNNYTTFTLNGKLQ